MRIRLPGSVARLRPRRRDTGMLAAAFLAVVALLMVFPCSCEEPLDTIGTPVITFEAYSVELEPAHPGDEVYAEFNYRNEGDASLIISEIKGKSLTEGC